MGANTRDAPDLTGLFLARRRRRDSPLVKQSPNEAGSVVLGDLFFETPAGGAITIACAVGNAVAAGAAAQINQAVNLSCSVGNAVAAGTTATINERVTIACTVGNATADGTTAVVNQAVNLSCTPGDAIAAGISAQINEAVNLVCSVGNAVADGVVATIEQGSTPITINCGVGNASAAGIQAVINQAINLACTAGNAVADGISATITLSGSAIDVRVSWAEVDTESASCDVRVSWCEFDPNAASCDVRVSWCEFDPNAPLSQENTFGGAYFGRRKRLYFPTREDLEREHEAIAREIPQEVVKTAKEVIKKASIPRPEQDELDRAEAQFRAFLAALHIQWADDYARALLIEYELALLEQEEAQIAWLLFEM